MTCTCTVLAPQADPIQNVISKSINVPFIQVVQSYPRACTYGSVYSVQRESHDCSSRDGLQLADAGHKNGTSGVLLRFCTDLYESPPRFTQKASPNGMKAARSTWWWRLLLLSSAATSDCSIWTVVWAPTNTPRQHQGRERSQNCISAVNISILLKTSKHGLFLIFLFKIGRLATVDCVLLGFLKR